MEKSFEIKETTVLQRGEDGGVEEEMDVWSHVLLLYHHKS